jgi:hypothetical protein
MRHLPPSRLFSILAVATLAGCAAASPFRHRTPGPQESTVEVRNDRWQDVVVYLAREQSLFRLGVVQGKSTATAGSASSPARRAVRRRPSLSFSGWVREAA